MWVITATPYGDYSGRVPEPQPIAQFSSNKLAIEYLERSRLKNPTYHRRFKKTSILYTYQEAYVDYVDDLPLDPTPPKK